MKKGSLLYWSFLILLCKTYFSFAIEADFNLTLSLNNCVELGLKRNRGLELIQNQIEIDELRVKEAKTDFLPSLTFSYRQLEYQLKEDILDPQASYISLYDSSRSISAVLHQEIFTGFRLSSSYKASKNRFNISKATYTLTESETAYAIKQAYFAIIKAIEDKKTRMETLEKAKVSLERAKRRLELGKGTPLEVLGEEAFLLDAELNFKDAENNLKMAERNLLKLLELPFETKLKLIPPQTGSPFELSLEECLDTGLQERIELKQIEEQIELNKNLINTIQSRKYPNLSLSAIYSFYSQHLIDVYQQLLGYEELKESVMAFKLNIKFSPLNNSNLIYNHSFYYNLDDDRLYLQEDQVAFSLFDGTSTAVSLEEAKLALRKTQKQLADTKTMLKERIISAYESYQESNLAVEAAKKHFEFARETYRMMELGYNLGINSHKDLLDARTKMVQAEIAYHQALYLNAIALARLEWAIGRN